MQALILAFNVPCLLKKCILVIAHIQLIMVLIVCLPISAFDYIMVSSYLSFITISPVNKSPR